MTAVTAWPFPSRPITLWNLTMRKLNVRFFVLLLVTVIVLAGGFFLVHRFQRDRLARGLLYQAERARDEGQIEKAIPHYVRYLEFKPDDATVMTALGALIEQQIERQPLMARNPGQVVYLYEGVLQRDPSRDDLRRKLVGFYLLPRLRRHADALTHIDVLQQKFPEDGSLWQQRAICLEASTQYELAAEALTRATQFPPDQVRSFELLARVLRRHLNRHQQADESIQAMVTQHADLAEAYLARARYRMEYNLGDVAEDAEKALSLAPENAEAILLIARVRQLQAKPREAIVFLERGLKKYPNDARMYRHLSWIEYNLKRTDAARQRLQEGIVACPDSFDLHTALAELLIQAKLFDQVQKIVDELKAKGVREDRIQYLSARIAIEREQWPEGVALLEKLRLDSRGNGELSVQVNLLLAHCYKQLGDGDRQFESYKRVFEFDALNVQARQGLASLHAQAGRFDDAIREYRHLTTLSGAPESAVADLIRVMITQKQRRAGENQSWHDVESMLDAAAKRSPTSTELLLVRSDLLAAQKRTKEAAALLREASATSKELRVWLQAAHYAELAEASGPATLDAAEKALGDHVELRLKRAALLLNRSHTEMLRSLPTLEKPGAQYSPDQTAQLQAGLAEMYFVVHDYANAKRLCRVLAQSRPGDLSSRVMLAEIALREKDRDALPGLLADIGKIEPAGGTTLPLLNARHQIALAEEGEPAAAEKARTLLEAVAQARPGWPLVHQSLARLAEISDDRAGAITHYRKAIENGDTDLRSYQRLVALLVETQQPKAAEDVVRQVAQRGSMSIERQRQMLQSVSPLLNTAVIQTYVQRSVSQNASDPSDHVWLGKMLWDLGERDKAIAEFRLASAQAGKVPENWITLVRALVASQQTDEANKAMEQARTELPPEKVAATMAICLEVARRFDEAVTEYARAHTQHPGDALVLRRYARLLLNLGQTLAATELLKDTITKPGSMSKEDIAWARRHLAILTTAERKPEQFQVAAELLSENERILGENLEDSRARVVLLAHAPPTTSGLSPRRQAISLLEKIIKHPLAVPQDRYSLAKLYDAEREWEKAEEQYRAVVASDPKNPAPLTHFARRLLQLGHVERTTEPLQRLERLAPTAPATVALKSRWYFRRGEIESLLSYLNSYVQVQDKVDPAERAFSSATLLDEFARSTEQPAGQPGAARRLYSAAIEMYQRSINRKPEAVVRASALLSHFGEMDKALAWLDTPAISRNINLKASATLAALRAGHADAERCRKTETWLTAEAKKTPTLDLALHLADLYELQHRFTDAEQLYRQVLQRHPNHVVVLNNLAWVLAQRQPTEEALILAQRAIAIAGPVPDLLDTRAKAYLALGRAPEAIQDLEDAIQEAPSALRYFQLALALERNANPDAARSAFGQARRHGLDVRDLHPADAQEFEKLVKTRG